MPFALASLATMLGIASFRGIPSLGAGFVITLVLYPIWGLTQQFALQNLVARNLVGLVGSNVGVAVVTGLVFAAAHVPRWPLVAVTLAAGFFFTLGYRRVPNLWALGLVHGVLGAVAIYLVSGEDPGAVVLRWLGS